MGQRKPLNFGFYFWPVIFFTIIGLIDTMYLTISHYKIHTDIWYQSFCAVTKAINCDTVSTSRFARMAGVPLAAWGVYGYLLVLVLAGIGFFKIRRKRRLWAVIFLLSILYCIYSLILAYISNYYIHSYCILCIASYCVNFGICFYSYIILKRFYPESFIRILRKDLDFFLSHIKVSFIFIIINGIILVCLLNFYPQYWTFKIQKPSVSLSHGITDKGRPWIGAKKPSLEIRMFSDYQCFQCRKMHFFLRNLLMEFPEKLRLVHMNFPMDQKINPLVKEKFHVGSGSLALMAKYSQSKGKFWELNDYLFHMEKIKTTGFVDIKKIADYIRIDAGELVRSINDPENIASLKKEIHEGLKLSVTGTPSFLINNKVYYSTIPKEVFTWLREG